MSLMRVLLTIAPAVVLMSGCQTVKLPNIDLVKLPEFKEDIENPSDYPNVADAPEIPTDVRSDKAWDKAARDIMAKRESFTKPQTENSEKSDAEILSDIERLKADARAYKADDPQP